ncbi:MAG TPA: hypothetical protein VFS21_20055, partial [Roseiflexaceae bacterium]|nr:hypothetical protein [Roseiflexaceae bacterium]
MTQPTEDRPPVWIRLLSLTSCDPLRAVRIAQKAFDRTTDASIEKQTLARYVLGRALLRYEELGAALPHLELAAGQLADQNKTLLAFQARRDALFAAMLLGKSDEQVWQALVESCSAAGQPLEQARTQMYLCAHYNRGGRPRAALELAASCAPILETQGTQEDRGRMLRIKAAAHGDCGEFGKALLFADEAVSVFRRLGWPVEIALSLTERAWHSQTIGEYHAALADLLEAHRTFDRIGLPLRIAICELHLGLLSSRLGQYEIALALTQIARQRFAELDQDPLFALCDLNTGIIFHYAGLNKQALRAYQHAEHVYRALGNQRMLLVSQRNQALALRQLDRYHDALKLLGDLQQEAEQLEDQDEQAELALASGEVLHDLGRYPEALAQLANAQHLFATTSKPAAVALCLLEQGWILLKQGAVEQAHEHFVAALPALRYRPMHRWRALHGLARCSAERSEQCVALDYYRETSGIIALLRTQLLSEHASSRIFAQAEEAYTQALNLALKLGDTDTVLELAETQRSLSLGKLIQRNSSGFTSRALALDRKLTLSPQQQYADTLDLLVEELLRQRHLDAMIDSSQ